MASGDTLAIYRPRGNQAPPLNYATLLLRNSHLVLEFPKSFNAIAVFEGFLPRNYAGGGITATIVWVAKTDTAGNALLTGAFERLADGGQDIDVDGFAAAQQNTGTAPGTSGSPRYTTIAFTNAQIDGLAAGEAFRLMIQRLADNVLDTMAGTLQLLRVELRET